MTQPPSVYADLTVAANVRYFARMVNVPTSEALAVLPTVDLDEYRDLIVGTLSEGERSRVSLLGTPELLVLDDPTVGLAGDAFSVAGDSELPHHGIFFQHGSARE